MLVPFPFFDVLVRFLLFPLLLQLYLSTLFLLFLFFFRFIVFAFRFLEEIGGTGEVGREFVRVRAAFRAADSR